MKLSKKIKKFLQLGIALTFLVAPIAGCTTVNSSSSVNGSLTEVGTPRNETLIMDNLDGKINNPTVWNPYLQGTDVGGNGLHQFLYSPLWEINTATGQQFGDIASKDAQPLDKNFKNWRISIRQGMYWSDGQELTADDVVFTMNMLLTHPSIGAWFAGIVKSAKLVDKYTLDVQFKNPTPLVQRVLGAYIWGNGFYVMPKHIWSKVDPTKYTNSNPVGMGPYVLKKVDPQGFWFLYEKRKDWQRSDVGLITGKEPGPKYILVRYYGDESKRVIAAATHKLDIMTDITPESWDILRKKDSYAKAWTDSFPYADMSDPAVRSITFNDSKAPYDKWQVRWALALATNLPETSMATFNGSLRAAATLVAPTDLLQDKFYSQIQDLLTGFKLPDGYSPYDTNYANKVADLLKQKGIKVPSDDAALKKEYGYGWWKYDPVEATKLLESVGFKKDSNGNWLMPDGKPWQMTINSPDGFEPESGRLSYAVSQQWKKFGINTTVQGLNIANFWGNYNNGTYDAGSYWPILTETAEFYDGLTQFEKDGIQPTGKIGTNNIRWSNDDATKIAKELNALPVTDPKVIPLEKQFVQTFVQDMPYIPMFGTSKFVPTDNYYWKGFPTSTNYYEGPWWWWSLLKFETVNWKPTGRK